MGTGRLALRLVVGGLFMGHGLQKLKGWFGGPGLEATESMMESMDMKPTRANAIAVGVAETAGGALIAAGLATPVAAATVIGVMTTAVRKVHLKNGLWNGNGGYEFNLLMGVAALSLAEDGPGKYSLDAARGHVHKGRLWGLFAMVGGVAGSMAMVAMGRRGWGQK